MSTLANAGDNLFLMHAEPCVTDTLRGVKNIVFLVGGSKANPRGKVEAGGNKQCKRRRALEIGEMLVKIGHEIVKNDQLLAVHVRGVCTKNRDHSLCCVYDDS